MVGISSLRAAALPLTHRFLGLLSTRAFGSAAALQLQYDYDDDDDDDYYYSDEEEKLELNRGRRAPREESAGSVSGRGVHWVVMGDPAAKKHIYAEKLSKLLEVPHISMTTLLRQELSPTSSLYRQIANAVNHGELVPEDVILGLLSNRLEEGYYRGETGFILDGIPRTRIQAEGLDQIADIDLVMNFKCCEFHSMSNAMSNLNLQSQDDQLKSSNSDKRGALTENFHICAEQRKLMGDYYRKQKKLLDFEVAMGAPGETWQGLLAALRLQHINALSSSHKLSA